MAARHGKRIILNPAPAQELDEDILGSLEYLVLNETEAEIIAGQKVTENNMEVRVQGHSGNGTGAHHSYPGQQGFICL